MKDLLLVIAGALIALGIDHIVVEAVKALVAKMKEKKEGE